MKNILFTIFCLFCVVFASAQEGKVMVTNTEKGNMVRIKWLEDGFYGTVPSSVYRREAGQTDWGLLTTTPVVASPIPEPFTEGNEGRGQALASELIGKRVDEVDDFLQILIGMRFVESGDFLKYLGIYYEDKTAEVGKTYEYKIVKLSGGAGRDLAVSDAITVGPYIPVLPVKEVELTVSEEQDSLVLVNWLAEPERYFSVNVYRTELPDGERLQLNENLLFPSFTEDSITNERIYPDFYFSKNGHLPGTTYRYELEARDFWNRGGELTGPIDIRIPDRTPAPLPVDFNLTKTTLKSVLISWNDLPIDNLSGINLYVSRDDENFDLMTPQPLEPVVTSYNYEADEFGHLYFIIETLNAEGIPNQSYSYLIGLPDLEPPMVPQNVQFAADTGRISITWDANPEGDLRGYILFRQTKGADEEDFVRLNATPFMENSYNDNLSKRRKDKFIYKVAAIDTSDNISYRSEPAGIRMPDVLAPAQPFITEANIDADNIVTITWQDVLDDDLLGYTVERLEKGGKDRSVLTEQLLNPTVTVFRDELAEAGIAYEYYVTARDNVNNTAVSEPYNVRIMPNTDAREGSTDIRADFKKRKNQVTIEWFTVQAEDVRGSMVFRKTNSGRFLPLSGLLSSENRYMDKDIKPDTVYTYFVKTYFTDGRVGSTEEQQIEVPVTN